MKVRDVMETAVVTVPIGTTYREVAKLLVTGVMSGLPVVDETGKVVGIVSEKDLFRVLYPYYRSFYENPELYSDSEAREHKAEDVADHPVESFMTTTVWTVEPDMPVMRAGALMLAKNIHRMPVMENGKLIGIVTRGHIYRTVFAKSFQD
ncbi:MAG: CBS domain-containing protein [Candidatus Uhrbacteria bacterium]